MQVHHRLAGGLSDVDADVVAVGVEPLVEEVFCLPDEGEEGGLLCVGRVEEGGDVAEGDEEEVAGADRVSIIAGVAEVVCEGCLLWGGLQKGQVRASMLSTPGCG